MEFDAGGEPRRPGCNAFGQGISAPDVVEAGDYGALSVTEYEATAIELLPQEPGHISGELVAQNVQYSFEQNDAPLGGSRVTLTGRKRHWCPKHWANLCQAEVPAESASCSRR